MDICFQRSISVRVVILESLHIETLAGIKSFENCRQMERVYLINDGP